MRHAQHGVALVLPHGSDPLAQERPQPGRPLGRRGVGRRHMHQARRRQHQAGERRLPLHCLRRLRTLSQRLRASSKGAHGQPCRGRHRSEELPPRRRLLSPTLSGRGVSREPSAGSCFVRDASSCDCSPELGAWCARRAAERLADRSGCGTRLWASGMGIIWGMPGTSICCCSRPCRPKARGSSVARRLSFNYKAPAAPNMPWRQSFKPRL